jgi:hypothetical protein
MGFRSDGDIQHFVCHRHFKVHPGLQNAAHGAQVPVLDMPPVLPQMESDAVGAGLFGHQGRVNRIRVTGAPCLTDGGYMVYVDAEADPFLHGLSEFSRETGLHEDLFCQKR